MEKDVPLYDVNGKLIEIGDVVTLFTSWGGDGFSGEVVYKEGKRCVRIMDYSYLCNIGRMLVRKE